MDIVCEPFIRFEETYALILIESHRVLSRIVSIFDADAVLDRTHSAGIRTVGEQPRRCNRDNA
jgi:hypothetical protein